MNREDIQKLLGGYATGTLTPEEEHALFAAALEDQELFDALGREQALRDLLRDPAAKAHLLAALDTPRGGFWNWLRRPMVAGVSIAAVAAVAIVAVWQTSQRPRAQVLVAEMKMKQPQLVAPGPAPVRESPAPDSQARPSMHQAQSAEEPRVAPQKFKTEAASVRDAMKDAVTLNSSAAPAPPPPPPAAQPPAAVAPPGVATTQTVEVNAEAAPQGLKTNAVAQVAADKLTLDARSLFYRNSFPPRANAPMPSAIAGSGGAQPTFRTAGAIAKKEVVQTVSLGVRVSVLRGAEEVAAATVLNAGESVRLRLTPNEDGFLYVATLEGGTWKMLASGSAQRLKPFETPPLPFAGAGEKQVYVTLSRKALTLPPQALAGLARTNLVEAAAEQDHATYFVANVPAEQVVQAITLTYK